MLWSSLNVVVMTILFMYMVNKAKCAETRKLALVPLATAAVELLAAGLLRPGLYPALTALLIATRPWPKAGRAGAPGPGERRWKHRGCGWLPSPPNAHDARLKRPSYRFGAGAVLRGR